MADVLKLPQEPSTRDELGEQKQLLMAEVEKTVNDHSAGGGRRMRKRKRKGKSVKKRGKRVTKKHKRSKKNNKNKKKRSTRKMRKRRSMRR